MHLTQRFRDHHRNTDVDTYPAPAPRREAVWSVEPAARGLDPDSNEYSSALERQQILGAAARASERARFANLSILDKLDEFADGVLELLPPHDPSEYPELPHSQPNS